MKKIRVTQTTMPDMKAFTDELLDIWKSSHLTNMGEKHEKLASQLNDFLDTDHLTLFTNGHLALESVIAALNLTGEVITTPFTFASTTHAIVRNGCVPVFCDIDPDTYTMDPTQIEKLITDKTSAIVPVHVYGTVCDVEAIERIARKHNLKVIYDAAHAFGVTVNGRGIGTFGDASMFSFHATKVFNTIEGGGVTYSDPTLSKALDCMKNFGITGTETVESIGFNAKMNEFQAAMGLVNLPNYERDRAKREAIVTAYNDRLQNLPGVKLMTKQVGVRSNYAYYPVVFEGEGWDRDAVADWLASHDIYVRKYFYPLVNDFDCYKSVYSSRFTPVARRLASQVVTLPLYSELALEDVDRICGLIEAVSPHQLKREESTQAYTV